MNRIYKFSMLAVIMIFTAACIMGLSFPALAQDVQVFVNGQNVNFDQKPYINKDGRTMVPVRAPMEATGATVEWNDAQKAATIKKDAMIAVFKAGSNQYTVNGTSKNMDTTAQIVNGRTCFPIRFVAEALGMHVTWDVNSKTVKITGVIEAPPGAKPMTDMTAEAKARLMAYPYPVDKNGKTYEVNEKMTVYGNTLAANEQDGYHWILTPVNQNIINNASNRFITDPDLCYSCNKPNAGERIRGILQTTSPDGSVTEQDIEYGFFYGTNSIQPGETPIPSHWYDEYDTVYLSAPVRVK